MNTCEKKIHSATSYLILQQPFIAVPLLRLELVATELEPTAATDGRAIFYNPGFLDSLSLEETAFLLAHEVLHVALAHHLRRGNRNPKAWNAAADYVINLILEKAGFKLIKGILLNPGYAGWSTEQVYRFIVQDAEVGLEMARQAALPNMGQPALDDFIPEGFGGRVVDMKGEDGSELSPADRTREEDALAVTINQALRADSMFRSDGGLRDAFARAVSKPRSPGLDARSELWEFVETTLGRDDYTWCRPNPRYLPMGLYLPALATSSTLGDIIIAIDTSGSITPRHLAFMAGACDDILAAFPQTTLHAVYCDHRVRSTEEITFHDRPVTLSNAQGGGGTRFSPVFDWVAEQGREPALLLYLTDLLGDWPEDPGYPVVWLAIGTKAREIPFGRRVDLSFLKDEEVC